LFQRLVEAAESRRESIGRAAGHFLDSGRSVHHLQDEESNCAIRVARRFVD
jgi:hypothetical protein